jgi:hypothetical protein
MSSVPPMSLVRNGEKGVGPRPSKEELRQEVAQQVEQLLAFTVGQAAGVAAGNTKSYKAFEAALIPLLFSLGRAVITLFLALSEEGLAKRLPAHVERSGRSYRRAPAQARNLETWFGVVRYWRTYMRQAGAPVRRGFHPLDVALGLTADRITMGVLALAVRLATRMSYEQARETLGWFLPVVPSTEVVEQAVLGLGRYSGEWFEVAPLPSNDGEVLIIMVDSKGAPTATEQELARRRGKRRKATLPQSPRHRGRKERARQGSQPRKAKGDHSKNARMATMVVMYTLTRCGRHLLGPVNRWVYASFAPKRHAFEIALREANRRGFSRDSGKTIQVVTDGDNDLARYAKEFFPTALRTVDVIHVVERLWTAGEAIHRSNDQLRREWVEAQKDHLYEGRIQKLLNELKRGLAGIPSTGPGNKGRRERLIEIIGYISKRKKSMNYKELRDKDLEIGSGNVEGAIKSIIGLRFDHGGMRWIRERAEALLQLRCIEVNGQWDSFISWAHDKLQAETQQSGSRLRIQQAQPAPLPAVQEAA